MSLKACELIFFFFLVTTEPFFGSFKKGGDSNPIPQENYEVLVLYSY